MSTHSLDVQLRTVLGKKVRRLRRDGLLPATVYGKGISPVSIQLDERAFNTTYRHAGRTALVELNIPEQPKQSAFIHAVQRHPVSRSIIHVDFRVVDLMVAITVEVPIVLTGVSPLVENEDAILNHALNAVQVRALPAELPQHIELDVSVLDEMDKTLHVRDLPTAETYTILDDPDELVVALSAPRVEEEEPEEEEEEAPAEPELIREEREEDEE
jgi:large subunit ribosomal protein L25